MLQPIPLVVVLYKDRAACDKLLASVDAQSYPCAPVVWDNTDDNHYVAYAWNRGIEWALAGQTFNMTHFKPERPHKYCILATQDVELEKDCVKSLVEFMDTHDKCAIAGVLQVRSDLNTIYHAGGAQAITCDIRGNIGGGAYWCGKRDDPGCAHLLVNKQMPWVNGSLLMVRLDAMAQIGLFDENMRLYCIDSDICYTARSRGWEVWYVADAVAIHDAGISTGENTSTEAMTIIMEDMRYFRHKWVGTTLFAKLAMELDPRFLDKSFETITPQVALDIANQMKREKADKERRQSSPMGATAEQTMKFLENPITKAAAEDAVTAA